MVERPQRLLVELLFPLPRIPPDPLRHLGIDRLRVELVVTDDLLCLLLGERSRLAARQREHARTDQQAMNSLTRPSSHVIPPTHPTRGCAALSREPSVD